NITLSATKAQVGQQAQIQAGGNVLVESLANTETSHTVTTAKSKTSYKNVDKGFIKQETELASIQTGDGLSISGNSGVSLIAAELTSQGNLILNAQTIKRDEEGNAILDENKHYLTENN